MSIKKLSILVLFTVVLLLPTQRAYTALGPVVLGVQLPKEAVPEPEPNRYYIKGKTFQWTIRYFNRVLARYKFRSFPAVELHPTVAAWHFQSLDERTPWEGINVSYIRGKVEVYLIERRPKRSS